jgi:hypothetical protein
MLSLVASSPIPDDPNRLISFAVTTEAPTTPLADVHQNLSSVCQSMRPSHNNSLPQNSDPPYKVSASRVKVELGGQVTGRSEALVIFQRTGNLKIKKFREELIAHLLR